MAEEFKLGEGMAHYIYDGHRFSLWISSGTRLANSGEGYLFRGMGPLFPPDHVRSLVPIVLVIQANRTGINSFLHKNPSLIIVYNQGCSLSRSSTSFKVSLPFYRPSPTHLFLFPESFQSFQPFPQWSPHPRSVSSF